MTATLLKSKANCRFTSVIPNNVPLPSLPLFGWVSHENTAGFEDGDNWTEYQFVDRGQITGIKWDGRQWLYTVQFYAQYTTHSDGSSLSCDEEVDDFIDDELTAIPDPRI